jgi:hypothetical protein
LLSTFPFGIGALEWEPDRAELESLRQELEQYAGALGAIAGVA